MFLLWVHWGVVCGQVGEAGRESLFSIGVGARALGLGSAGAAFPDDPSAFYWNPAGMTVVQERGAGFSLTTLFEGTQYNFVGYVHPTMDVGVFGVGVARIGTDGITETHWDRGAVVEGGEWSYWWGKLTLSYARMLVKGFSAGINFDVHRQVMGPNSANGYGLDVGIHYRFPQEGGLLQNLFLGCNWSNALRPRLKLGTLSEPIPYTIRGGIAKAFFFRREADRWLLLADVEKGEDRRTRYHVGMEYGWSGSVFLRGGLDNGRLAFGGGLRYRNFQIDYGTTQIADPEFPRSHRFTLVLYIGKSIPDQRRLLEEQRRQEIQSRIDEQMEVTRQRRITEGLQTGKEYLDRGDYFNARLEFARVLAEDKENAEAQRLLALTREKEQEQQRIRDEELIGQDREKEKRQRDNTFVNERFNEGLEALEEGDFKRAIERWEQALQRDPDNPQINTYIQQARAELENEVNRLIAGARQFIRQENLPAALRVLNRAKDQTEGNPELHNKVLREIENWEKRVDFLNNYQAGLESYRKRNYRDAVRFFQKALEYEPTNSRAKELYRNALARSQGTRQTMTGDVKERFNQGLQLYVEGRYEEALKVWEEALELDPQNVRLLDAIEGVKKKIELYRKEE